MNWRMLGKPVATAEMNGKTVYQTVKIPMLTNMVIRGVTVGLIAYNDPDFTSLYLNLWDDDSGVPGKIIAQSDAITKPELHTLDHAFKVVGFTFQDIPVKAGTLVHFALGGVGYVGDASSHIAWRNSYPDPQFITGLTLDAAHADNHPFEVCLVGAEL